MELIAGIVPDLASILNILTAAIGLGLVIFVHELGHFAVAKWCGVYVERFSIGFGPMLWCRKWGETEYALSAVPFGGYVKMRGQDDIDPGQMTDEQVAADPRSYTSKSVPQRMAIISAGVIMNLITGWMFFCLAFRLGVEEVETQVGDVVVGMPAWTYGIRPGDTIQKINGRKTREFSDIVRGVALSSGRLVIDLHRPSGETYTITMDPDKAGDRRRLGIDSISSLKVHDKALQSASPGTPADKADFKAGDQITEINGVPVKNWLEVVPILYEKRSETLDLTVVRKPPKDQPDASPSTIHIKLPPAPVKTLGLRLELGKITAIRNDSPAARAQIKVGDRLVKVDGNDVGLNVDPQHLPQFFYEHRNQPIKVVVQRDVPGGEPETHELTVTADDTLPGSEPPFNPGSPMSIPGLGLAFQFLPTILSVDEGGPAAKAGIKQGMVLAGVKFLKRTGEKPDMLGLKDAVIPIDVKNKDGSWAYALWLLQNVDSRDIAIMVKDDANAVPREVALTPVPDGDQFQPTLRGLDLSSQTRIRKAENFGVASEIGARKTLDSITEVYLTIRSLVRGDMSYKNLHGPLGIAKFAYIMADQGPALFLLFLGAISMNLAVINFLPIPVLDGGHMVFLLYEGVTGKKPTERVIATATYIGLALVLTLMVTVICLDLFVHRG
ncbi:MAG: RIP metalloprotease RseP [Planctomycetaceae bacterium]